MTIKNILHVLALAGSGLLSSCSFINYSSAYDANSLNIPLHKQEKELKGSAGYASVLGFNTDFSYSVTNNFSVKGAANLNHQFLIRDRWFGMGGDHWDLENHYLEGGVAYFKYFSQSYINSLEVSTGYGNGTVYKRTGLGTFNSGQDDRLDGNFHKYFLQANFGHVADNFEFGFGIRYAGLRYPSLIKRTSYGYAGATNLHFNSLTIPVSEFAGMVGYGGKKLKGTLQYGLAISSVKSALAKDQRLESISFNSAICQIGLRYNLNVNPD